MVRTGKQQEAMFLGEDHVWSGHEYSITSAQKELIVITYPSSKSLFEVMAWMSDNIPQKRPSCNYVSMPQYQSISS